MSPLFRDALQRADRHALLVVVARATRLAQVRADVARDARQRVAREDHFERAVVLALRDQPGVLGHVLLDRAGLDARRHDAIPESEARCDLREAVGEGRFAGSEGRREPPRRQRETFARRFRDQAFRFAASAAVIAASALASHCVMRAKPPGFSRSVQPVTGIAPHERMAAMFSASAPAGVRHVQIAVERMQQLLVQRHRHRVQRPPRHVHLVAGQAPGVVAHRQRVAQLHAEGEAALRCRCPQGAQSTATPASYCRSCSKIESGISMSSKPRRSRSMPQHARLAKQRRVQLDDRVQSALFEQVPRDPLDFVRRASVHRRERHAVDDAAGNGDAGEMREVAADRRLDGFELLRRVGQRSMNRVIRGRLMPSRL